MEDNQPKGIGFYNIKSGETHYARLEAQIQAYINSSDMGINASRDQDFGWRLEPQWVKAVKAFRRNETKMQFLTDRNGGQKVTTPQILYAIYGEQLRAAQERADEEEAPFEEEYLAAISTKSDSTLPEAAVETVSAEDIGVSGNVDDLKEEEPTPEEPGIAKVTDDPKTTNEVKQKSSKKVQ